MSLPINQGPYGNRMMYNTEQMQQQQQSQQYMNRINPSHVAVQPAVSDDITAGQPVHRANQLQNYGLTHMNAQMTAAQTSKEILNPVSLCRSGRETVQELVSRCQDVLSYLKSMQPPIGIPLQDKTFNEKRERLHEVFRGMNQLFRRLHSCYDKVQEHTASLEYTQIESLIPLRDEPEVEKKKGDAYRLALDEHAELVKQVNAKNHHMKEIIDQLRSIIWETNTMLQMREPPDNVPSQKLV